MTNMIIGIPASRPPLLPVEQNIAHRVKPLLDRLSVEYYCRYTNDPLYAPPVKGNWLSYLTPAAQRRVLKNNEVINKWLIKSDKIDDPLPPVPCHRTKNIFADGLVPGSPRINPGEARSVIGLWLKYVATFQTACEKLPIRDLGLLITELIKLENLYMGNWHQVSNAIDIINAQLAPPPIILLNPPSPAPQPEVLLLPAICETTRTLEALRVCHLLKKFSH